MDTCQRFAGLLLFAITAILAQDLPPRRQETSRPDADFITCPPRAACAILMKFPREMPDGSYRQDERATRWCTCDETRFPLGCFGNPDKFVAYDYSGATGWAYATCESANEIPLCEGDQIAMEIKPYEDNPLFYGKKYNQINCECPANRVRPLPSSIANRIFVPAPTKDRYSIVKHQCRP